MQTKALIDVIAERERQQTAEGFTVEHDKQYDKGQLARAAAIYAIPAELRPSAWYVWPWLSDWFKPSHRRRELVKAAALLLAAIEQIDNTQK